MNGKDMRKKAFLRPNILKSKNRLKRSQLHDVESIRHQMSKLNTREQMHLEDEFADFYQQYPKE